LDGFEESPSCLRIHDREWTATSRGWGEPEDEGLSGESGHASASAAVELLSTSPSATPCRRAGLKAEYFDPVFDEVTVPQRKLGGRHILQPGKLPGAP